MDLREYAKNAALLSSRVGHCSTGNSGGTQGQLTPYFAEETRRFLAENAKYAANFFAAEVDSMNSARPEEKRWYRIRVADAVGKMTLGTNLLDSWKTVYFESPEVNELPRGAKLWFGENIWICVNPANLGSVAANGIIRRCNAVWGTMDYYGNPVYEPFIENRQETKANGNSYLQYNTLADNYIDCIMAMDAVSRSLTENTRMLLGSSAYTVTGLNNSARERTEDKNSVRILTFSLHRSEPHEGDDRERGIADAGSFSWEITISGAQNLPVGSSTRLTASSLRSGEPPTGECSYLWNSSDSSVLTVDDAGTVTAVGEGRARIRCRLQQNPTIEKSVELTASAFHAPPLIRLDGAAETLAQYTSATLTATLWGEGTPEREDISFDLKGAPARCYEAVRDKNRLTISCYYPSEIPLTVTARGGGGQAELQLKLVGA